MQAPKQCTGAITGDHCTRMFPTNNLHAGNRKPNWQTIGITHAQVLLLYYHFSHLHIAISFYSRTVLLDTPFWKDLQERGVRERARNHLLLPKISLVAQRQTLSLLGQIRHCRVLTLETSAT